MLCLKSGRLSGIMRTVTALVTALCLVTTTSAIFEEQVGLMDWYVLAMHQRCIMCKNSGEVCP